MAEAPTRLELDSDGDGFLLSRTDAAGVTVKIPLSAEDILSLPRAALTLRERSLAERQSASGETEAVLATPVMQVGVNREILGDNVLLTMVAADGTRLAFALPSALAADVAERISGLLQGSAASQPVRQ